MKRTIELGKIIGLSAIASLAIAPLAVSIPGEQDERSFTLSTDPAAVVLEYRFAGGLRRGVVYTLYGDGRLVRVPGDRISDQVAIQLDPQEADNLVRSVVDAGLVECGSECIQETVKACMGLEQVPRAADGGEILLTLNLETYQEPGASQVAAIQRRIRVHSPGMLARYCPEIQELRQLLELETILRELQEPASGLCSLPGRLRIRGFFGLDYSGSL
jgi:hypothetical protein